MNLNRRIDPCSVYTIYKNVLAFIKFNGISQISGGDINNKHDVDNIITKQSYIMIKGVKRDGADIYICILGKDISTGDKVSFGDISGNPSVVTNPNKSDKTYVLLISEHVLKANIVNAIMSQQVKKNTCMLITCAVYNVFKVDMVTDSSYVYKILSDVETSKVKEELRKGLYEIPYILASDPMMIWVMGQPGQLVEIMHPSIIAGRIPYYRTII